MHDWLSSWFIFKIQGEGGKGGEEREKREKWKSLRNSSISLKLQNDTKIHTIIPTLCSIAVGEKAKRQINYCKICDIFIKVYVTYNELHIFKENNLLSFHICRHSENHHHNKNNEHVHQSQKFPHIPVQSLPVSLSDPTPSPM